MNQEGFETAQQTASGLPCTAVGSEYQAQAALTRPYFTDDLDDRHE